MPRHGDFIYDTTKPLRTLPARVVKRAVYNQLSASRWFDLGLLQHMWRARVTALRRARFANFAHPRYAQYARNCPPYGAAPLAAAVVPCCRPLACPFCYARQWVAAPFLRLYNLFRGAPELTVWSLVAWLDAPTPADLVLDLRATDRQAAVPKSAAACDLWRPSPAARGWRLRRGLVLVMPHGAEPPAGATAHGGDLIRACARAWAYDRRLLTCDAWDLAAFALAFRRVRLTAAYGPARG
jgi:hypothetical protein